VDRKRRAERVVNEPPANPVRLRQAFPDLGINLTEEGINQHVLGEPIHFARDVDGRRLGPSAQHPLDLRVDRFGEGNDDLSVEGGLYKSALSNVRLSTPREEPGAEYAAAGTAARLPTLRIVRRAINEHMVNVVRLVDEERRTDDTQTHGLAVAAMARCQESESITLKVPPIAKKRRAPLAADVVLHGRSAPHFATNSATYTP
jgi:hypothetical protein